MTSTTTAKKCFAENIRLFGDARTQPEKFNLYNGLAALADAIAEVQSKLDALDARMRRLEATR